MPKQQLQLCPTTYGLSFQSLLQGVIPAPEQLIAQAKQREQELRHPDHRGYSGHTPLERRWYTSLFQGHPDYSVYLTDDYLAEAWACWSIYSRDLFKKIAVPTSLSPTGVLGDLQAMGIHSVVDLGCGLGLSTATLTEFFPGADVIGTNVPQCAQYQVASHLGERYGFSMTEHVATIKRAIDLVLASEYFEHFEQPLQHLLEVIQAISPHAFLIANAFNVPSTGHFPSYIVGSTRVPGKEVGRLFNQVLRQQGYSKIQTKLWNNRPTYWKRRDIL